MHSTITPQQAKALLETQNALFVDIREPDEYAREHIAGSRLAPLSVLSSLPEDPDQDRPAVFFCHSGRRTQNSVALLEARGFKEIYLMEGGLSGWKAAGLPLVSVKRPLPINRQIQMAAGTIILLSLLLSLVSPVFLWITAFAGAGLFLAGLTGVCLMGQLLMRMPWNAKDKGKAG